MITFDPWTFWIPSLALAYWAYRIRAKKGHVSDGVVVAVFFALVLFGIGIYVE